MASQWRHAWAGWLSGNPLKQFNQTQPLKEFPMNRQRLINSASGLLLFFAILTIPDIFLFAKTVPNSFWTENFSLPFGAGWFVAFTCLAPTAWSANLSGKDLLVKTGVTLLAIIMAVPIALSLKTLPVSINSLINQYLWVSLISFPPLALHLCLRWVYRQDSKTTKY